MPEHGKKYRLALTLIEEGKKYNIKEAVALIKKTAVASFDSTVEIHISTGANVKHANQVVRATITLPKGTGKNVRIAVFCDEGEVAEAKKAGADVVGGEDLIGKVGKGEIDFDVAVATPKMMKALAKVARVLGPKGLMPSPKAGTVTTDIKAAVSDLKKGKIEFKTDKTGIIHSVLGKSSFSETDLAENATAFLKAVMENKPVGIKSIFIKSITFTTSMGPGIPVDIGAATG